MPIIKEVLKQRSVTEELTESKMRSFTVVMAVVPPAQTVYSFERHARNQVSCQYHP